MTTFYDLWKKSQDVKIKERILVAWAVMLISADIKNYSYVKKFVNKIKEDEPTIVHLYAIQKQILFCMDAAEDAQQFSADIMNAFPDENGTGLWKTMRNLLLTRFSLQKRKRKW